MNKQKDDSFKFAPNSKANLSIEVVERKSATREAIEDFFKNKIAVFGLVIFLALFFTSVIVFFTSPHNVIIGDSNHILENSSSTYWFGTDQFGRDLWTRVWYGVLISTLIAFFASIINIILAGLVGIVTGYFDTVDKFFNPIIKILYSLPSLLILILFSVVFGPSFWIIILSLTITGWVGPSQQIRAHTLRVRNLDFITASQTLGTSKFKILQTFINLAIPTIIIQFSMIFPKMILAESILGFLGLSIPDVPTLGTLINLGRGYILLYPMQVFYPVIFLVGIVGSIQFVAFGIEDAFGSSRTGR